MFIKKNNVLKCLFLLLFLKSSLANHSLAWAWSMKQSFTVRANFSLKLWSHKRLNAVDLLLFHRESFYGFQWVTYENFEKNIRFILDIFIYIMYGSQAFWSFMKFYFVHIVKVCFVFKKQFLCLYFSVYE